MQGEEKETSDGERDGNNGENDTRTEIERNIEIEEKERAFIPINEYPAIVLDDSPENEAKNNPCEKFAEVEAVKSNTEPAIVGETEISEFENRTKCELDYNLAMEAQRSESERIERLEGERAAREKEERATMERKIEADWEVAREKERLNAETERSEKDVREMELLEIERSNRARDVELREREEVAERERVRVRERRRLQQGLVDLVEVVESEMHSQKQRLGDKLDYHLESDRFLYDELDENIHRSRLLVQDIKESLMKKPTLPIASNSCVIIGASIIVGLLVVGGMSLYSWSVGE
jgi:hypothetical protein